MNIITPYFEHQLKEEAVNTRKMLQAIPDDKYDWAPHPKSMRIRQLATHIAEIPAWIPLGLDTTELDFSKGEYTATPIHNSRELLDEFEKNHAKALEALSNTSDEFIKNNTWSMRNGEQLFFTISKQELIRMSISQIIHHRAQMGVFLRLLDIPVPGAYGPSADEMGH